MHELVSDILITSARCHHHHRPPFYTYEYSSTLKKAQHRVATHSTAHLIPSHPIPAQRSVCVNCECPITLYRLAYIRTHSPGAITVAPWHAACIQIDSPEGSTDVFLPRYEGRILAVNSRRAVSRLSFCTQRLRLKHSVINWRPSSVDLTIANSHRPIRRSTCDLRRCLAV